MRKQVVLILILLITVSTLTQGVGFWRQLPSAPVAGAQGQALVGTGESLFLIWNDSLENAPQLWEYVGSSETWSSRSTEGLPPGSFQPGAALAWDGDQTLYALGGSVNEDENRRAFFKYDLRNRRWNRIADTPHPQGEGNAMVWDPFGKRIYAFLGSKAVDSVFARYSPSTNQWETLPFPDGWDCTGPGTSLVSLRQFGVYALQGECLERQPQGQFAVYNLFRSEWTLLASMPEPVGPGGSLLSIGEFDSSQSLFMFALAGGRQQAPGFSVYRYNVDNNFWFRLVDHFCPVGTFTGNRLGYVNNAIHYWQGSPTSDEYLCGGNGFLQLLGLN